MLNLKHQVSSVDEPKDITVSKGISLVDEQAPEMSQRATTERKERKTKNFIWVK